MLYNLETLAVETGLLPTRCNLFINTFFNSSCYWHQHSSTTYPFLVNTFNGTLMLAKNFFFFYFVNLKCLKISTHCFWSFNQQNDPLKHSRWNCTQRTTSPNNWIVLLYYENTCSTHIPFLSYHFLYFYWFLELKFWKKKETLVKVSWTEKINWQRVLKFRGIKDVNKFE